MAEETPDEFVCEYNLFILLSNTVVFKLGARGPKMDPVGQQILHFVKNFQFV